MNGPALQNLPLDAVDDLWWQTNDAYQLDGLVANHDGHALASACLPPLSTTHPLPAFDGHRVMESPLVFGDVFVPGFQQTFGPAADAPFSPENFNAMWDNVYAAVPGTMSPPDSAYDGSMSSSPSPGSSGTSSSAFSAFTSSDGSSSPSPPRRAVKGRKWAPVCGVDAKLVKKREAALKKAKTAATKVCFHILAS